MRLIALVVLAGCASAPPAQAPDPKEMIPAATQQMLDALPSDAAVWERYLSADAVYLSEAGDVATKKEMLESFAPFPPGLSGSIKVTTIRLDRLGDVAIHVFDAHETQQVYDQSIAVHYRSSHVWRVEGGEWKLLAATNLVMARDPAPTPVRADLSEYAGVYELSGQRRYRVEVREGGLAGGRDGGTLVPLIPVGENVFVAAGDNLGILRIFVRNAAGSVDRMLQRRKHADTVWMRVGR